MCLEERRVCSKTIRGVVVEVLLADITRLRVDAIVNPANSLMVMGGGVARAIRRAGGAEIEEEARGYAPVPVGSAVATGAGRLPARYVIHAPTMERPAMRTTPEKVRAATRAALRKAEDLKVDSIALPGMGTGVGGVPFDRASKVMVEAIAEHVAQGSRLRRIVLAAIEEELANAFCSALEKVGAQST